MKFNVIWQTPHFAERDWISELFAPHMGDQVWDGKHSIVLDNCILIDSYLKARPQSYYAQFKGKNAFLVHLVDENYDGGYQHYDNFCGVFRQDWSDIFNPRRVVQLPLGYANSFKGGSWQPGTAHRTYLWSFLGGASKTSRPEMIKALTPLTPHLAHITDRGVPVERLNKEQYAGILRNSIFAPSAMGNVNLECYRMYEALECGAIPVLERRIGFDYYQRFLGDHPMPVFLTWAAAARWMAEIRTETATLDDLQARCVQWWATHKLVVHEQIRNLLEHSPGDEAGPYLSWKYSIPGWQIRELLHHHTAAAAFRRLSVMVNRILKEGKLRKATGAKKAG
jgi:hypothetical protein